LIHPTAIVDPSAVIGEDVEIGPYVIIEEDTIIGDGCRIFSHAVIKNHTIMGSGNTVHEHAVLGGDPQDLSYDGSSTGLVIGNDNVFRECVTVHRSTKQDQPTCIGNSNFFMAYSHIAHDCQLEDRIIFANCATLAGHISVGTGAFVSGSTAVHQFCQIGAYSILSGVTPVSLDAPPFMIVAGNPAGTVGLNVIGMRRAGFSRDSISKIKQAYKILMLSGKSQDEAMDEMANIDSEHVSMLIDFIKNSKRGITRHRKK